MVKKAKKSRKKTVKKAAKKSKPDFDMINSALAVFLCLVLVFNFYNGYTIKKEVKSQIEEAKEASRPAEINLYTISERTCEGCSNVQSIIDSVKNANVEIIEEAGLALDSPGAMEMVEKYQITKLPAVIVTGELEKANLGLDIREDGAVFDSPSPPYYDISSRSPKGYVQVIYLENDCEDCFDVKQIVSQFKQGGVYISRETDVALESNAGQKLVEKYSITRLPTAIFSTEMADYEQISSIWNNVGTVEKDGKHIMRNFNPPYYDLNEEKTVGLVTITYLSDASCETCYNVANHKQILPRFGLNIKEEVEVDVSDAKGRELVEEYDIKLVPTIIISSEADYYSTLKGIWPQVGVVAEDGTFVFTAVPQMGTHKDLSSGKVVDPRASS